MKRERIEWLKSLIAKPGERRLGWDGNDANEIRKSTGLSARATHSILNHGSNLAQILENEPWRTSRLKWVGEKTAEELFNYFGIEARRRRKPTDPAVIKAAIATLKRNGYRVTKIKS